MSSKSGQESDSHLLPLLGVPQGHQANSHSIHIKKEKKRFPILFYFVQSSSERFLLITDGSQYRDTQYIMQKESKSFFWRFGNPLEEQEERLKVSEWVVDARRTCPPNQLSGFHMASARLKLPVLGLHESEPGPLCIFQILFDSI